jgi:hypothetical protein
MLTGMFPRGVKVPQTSEVIYDKEPSDLSEGVYHSRAPAQPRCRRLEYRRCTCSVWSIDLPRVCGDRHSKPVPVPAVPESLLLLAPYRMWGHREKEEKRQSGEETSCLLIKQIRSILSKVRDCGLEGLKFQSQQAAQSRFVQTGRFRQTVLDRLLEQLKVRVIVGREAFLSDEFPQAFNQIEIGGVGRETTGVQSPQQRPSPARADSGEQRALSITTVMGVCSPSKAELLEELTDTGRIDVALIGDGHQLMGDGIQGAQHVEALSPARRTHHHAGETPEETKVGPQHKMGGIDEKDGPLAGLGLG